MTWLPWCQASPRLTVIHLDAKGSLGQAEVHRDPNALREYLRRPQRLDGTPRRSIYILESLSKDFVTVLQYHFQLRSIVFQDHEKHVALYNRTTGEAVGVPLLPSANYGRDYVSLKYHEPLVFSPAPTGYRNICDVSGRHISVTRVMSNFSEVGVARRKCTIWSRETKDSGWDCKLL
jgi:hypothetical protein